MEHLKPLITLLLLLLAPFAGCGQSAMLAQSEHLYMVIELGTDSGFVRIKNVSAQDVALYDLTKFKCKAQSYHMADSSFGASLQFNYGTVVYQELDRGIFKSVVLPPDSSLEFSLPPSVQHILSRDLCRSLMVDAMVYYVVLDERPHPCVPYCTAGYFEEHAKLLSLYWADQRPCVGEERPPVREHMEQFSLTPKE